MDKNTFIGQMLDVRQQLEEQLGRFLRQEMEIPCLDGGWSIKDLMAHIAWSEREMIPLFRDHVLGGSPLWLLPTDERNRVVFEENKNRFLEEVLADEAELYSALYVIISTLEDEDFNDPARYKNMPEDWMPWQILDGSTTKHYEEHSADLARLK